MWQTKRHCHFCYIKMKEILTNIANPGVWFLHLIKYNELVWQSSIWNGQSNRRFFLSREIIKKNSSFLRMTKYNTSPWYGCRWAMLFYQRCGTKRWFIVVLNVLPALPSFNKSMLLLLAHSLDEIWIRLNNSKYMLLFNRKAIKCKH